MKRGFTLIELLVVISIISLLASIVVSSLNSARSSARDSYLIQSAQQMAKALEMYYLDNGFYPGANSSDYYITAQPHTNDETDGCGHNDNWCNLEVILQDYIGGLPRSKTVDNQWRYKIANYGSAAKQYYGIRVLLDNPTDASRNDGGDSDDYYEIGNLLSYCDSKGEVWASWNSSNCATALSN